MDAETDTQLLHNMATCENFLHDNVDEFLYYKSSVNTTDKLTYATMIRDPQCVEWDETTVLYKWNKKALLILLSTMERADFIFEECNQAKVVQM